MSNAMIETFLTQTTFPAAMVILGLLGFVVFLCLMVWDIKTTKK